ncbi:MAG: ester cyclase [Chloroflexota bacterium]|nr:ester cyclase [Chloroflexota bacterium]
MDLSTMSVDTNRDTAVRYFNEVVGAGNLELIEELVHPEAQDLSGEWPAGREGFREHISWFHSSFELEITIDRVIAGEEYAVVYWTVRGRHVGLAFGIEPSGKVVENSAISTMRFRDGLIVEYEVMFNMINLFVQLESLGSWAVYFSK